MNYRPEGLNVGDTWYFHHDGLTHCIHMQQLCRESVLDTMEDGALGHAVSDDLIKWKTMPTALYKGEKASYDDCDLWTGCVIRHEGVLYLFYTARCSDESGINRIALAVSKDGFSWEKHSANPVITPDSRWYHGESNPIRLACHSWPIVDCRDLCVVKDEKNGGYWGFFAVRQPGRECTITSVIGLCHSFDLVHWEQHPPCFVPEKYNVVEVPEVFYLDGRWYMLCLTGNVYGQRNRTSDPNLSGLATIYAVSENPQGPYYEMDENVLIGAVGEQGYCSKTVGIEGERYVFYTQQERKGENTFKTVSLPKVLRTDEKGHLSACYYQGVERYLGAPLLDKSIAKEIGNKGQWGSIGQWESREDIIKGFCKTDWALQIYDNEGSNFIYTAQISIADARSAGLVFRVQGEDVYGGAYVILLDAHAQEVLFTKTRNFPRIEVRKWKIDKNRTYDLRIVAIDGIVEAYIDDVLAIQLFHPDFQSGRFGLFVEQGNADFKNIGAFCIDK